MALNLRRKKVLCSILSTKENLSLSYLMESYGISLRMARYDIKAVSEFLMDMGLPPLGLDKNGNIIYDVRSLDEKAVQHTLEMIKNSSMEYLQVELRLFVLAARMLLTTDQITISELADSVNVSRNTVIGDLSLVRSWLLGHGIKVRSVPKRGLVVSGRETDIRRAYISLLQEALPLERLSALHLQTLQAESETTYPDILLTPLLSSIEFGRIQKYSTQIQRSLRVVFTDVSNANLVLALALLVFRVRQGRCIPDNESLPLDAADTQTYSTIFGCLMDFQSEFEVVLLPAELRFITQYVQISGILSTDSRIGDNASHVEKELLARDLISGVSRDLGVNLHMDTELFYGVQAELVPMAYRLKHHIRMANPLTTSIRRNYSELSHLVEKNTNSLKLYMDSGLSEDDIGMLSIHFIAAMERINQTDQLPNVVVVCGFGLGSANILTIQLRKLFHIHIVDVIALRDLGQCLADNRIDLIITTVPIAFPPVPCVYVSPFISDQDIIHIGRNLMTIRDMAKRRLPEEEGKGPGLLDLLTSDLMDLDYRATDFYDAIRRSGELLHLQGIVEDRYVSAMVSVVKELGPYIVFMPGFALAHANADAAVHKPGVSLIRLRNPVVSGHPSNDPVCIVFAVAIPGERNHLRAIMELSKVIASDAGRLFVNAADKAELLDIIGDIIKA